MWLENTLTCGHSQNSRRERRNVIPSSLLAANLLLPECPRTPRQNDTYVYMGVRGRGFVVFAAGMARCLTSEIGFGISLRPHRWFDVVQKIVRIDGFRYRSFEAQLSFGAKASMGVLRFALG